MYIAEPDVQCNNIAFTTYSTEANEYTSGEHVLYNGILANEGQHYQPSSSYFICPDDELYVFSIDIMSDIDASVAGVIMIENTFLMMAYAERQSDQRTESSALAIAQCARGKKVWVKLSGDSVAWSNGNRHVSFTGFRLNSCLP